MTTQTITQLVNQRLDQSYKQAMRNVIAQIQAITTSANSKLQKVLEQLDQRAQQLEMENSTFSKGDAVIEQTLSETSNVLTTTQTIIDPALTQLEDEAVGIAAVAVTAKVFLDLATSALRLGINPVDAEAMSFYQRVKPSSWSIIDSVDAASHITRSPEWIARMEGWGSGYSDLIRQAVLQGIEMGNGPFAIAAKIRQLATGIPQYAAERIARTLQINAYRDRAVEMELQNGRFMEYKIRIATLDNRTCLSCIALHGTQVPVGQKIDDHYQGRCSEYYVVPGGPRYPTIMQADSTPGNRKFVPFQTGTDWFNSLPESRQRQQLSFVGTPAKFNAFKSGAVSLDSFIGHHVDDVFGPQAIERSLKSILGEEGASQFYVRNYGKQL